MRKNNSKGKEGVLVVCPRCKYHWRTRQKPTKLSPYICCSKCKRYFKIK